MDAKKGVILSGLSIEMTVAMRVVEKVYKSYGYTITITCGLEGIHMAGSLHYSGYALDIRTSNIGLSELYKIVKIIRNNLKLLDTRYGVLLHATHLHIQYKPERYTELWGLHAN